MRRLSLGEFAQIAEIVAAVAVVVSLVYVGIGLRDNTFAVRSASAQAVTNTSLDILFEIDPKLWGTHERVICATMDKPGVRESWHIHSSVLDPGFVALAEACSSF